MFQYLYSENEIGIGDISVVKWLICEYTTRIISKESKNCDWNGVLNWSEILEIVSDLTSQTLKLFCLLLIHNKL